MDGDSLIETVTLSDENNWEYTFKDLVKYRNGKEIEYKVTEEDVDGYSSEITGNRKDGFVITNTNSQTVDIPVKKEWIGKAAESVTVKLIADQKVIDTAELTANDDWTYTFKNLPKYDQTDGHEIEYDISEDDIAGYTQEKAVSEEGNITFINTNTSTINIPVTKRWVGEKAENASVKLIADEKVIETVMLNESNEWAHTFTNLPVYDSKDGHEIEYDVQEESIEGYISGRSGTAKDGFTFTNTITGKVSVPVTKKWDGPKLDSATIELLADGKRIDSTVLNENNNWQHTFTDLEKYDNGKEIEYTISEPKVANYKTEISGNAQEGFTVTNTNTEVRTVNVTKKWVGNPADKIIIRLYADGVEIDKATITKADGWKHSFNNLPVYTKDGKKISYSVSEDQLKGYKTEIEGDADS